MQLKHRLSLLEKVETYADIAPLFFDLYHVAWCLEGDVLWWWKSALDDYYHRYRSSSLQE